MRRTLVGLVLAVVAVGAAVLGGPQRSDAAFHLMRVYGAMGGAAGDANIQYVELRMTTGGQNLVARHDICFYDAAGAPYAKFRFATNAPNGGATASILIGSGEFDAAWAAGSPDYLFNGSTVTQIAALADVNHPIRLPAGKIAFGTETATTPAAMCQAGFALVDSVAYGTGYTGTVNFGTKFNTDMPSAGTQAVRLTGALCTPGFSCGVPPDNSTDYSLLDVNVAANNVRNNAGQTGPLSASDSDGDGVADATDNCPDWANASQQLPDWTLPAGDTDCDGYHATAAFGARAPEATIGTVPTQHCAATSGTNDEALPDAWPPDFNDNQLVNVGDILSFNFSFGKHTTDPAVNFAGTVTPIARWDLNASGLVNVSDVLQLNPFMFKRCN